MGETVLRGEIPLRVRKNADTSRILQSIAPLLELQGLSVTELSERQLKFTAIPHETRRAGNDLEFIRNATVLLAPRGGRLALRYYATVSTPPWPLMILGAVIFIMIVIATGSPRGIGCSISLPVPALSLAAFGDRSARQKRLRKVIAEAVDSLPGLDC